MPHRTITDVAGLQWDIWSIPPESLERRRETVPPVVERRKHTEARVRVGAKWSGGWLAFESATEKRRLTPIPGNWERLSEEELRDCLLNAEQVRSSRPVGVR